MLYEIDLVKYLQNGGENVFEKFSENEGRKFKDLMNRKWRISANLFCGLT